MPFRENSYDLRDLSSFQALVRRETNEVMELVHAEHKQDLQTKHQDRYTACLDVLPRGKGGCGFDSTVISQGFPLVYILPPGSQKGTAVSRPAHRWIQLC